MNFFDMGGEADDICIVNVIKNIFHSQLKHFWSFYSMSGL